jgi:hypothetical protein
VTTPELATIARVAQAALDDPHAQVASWERTPLSWVAIAPTTAELARYSGTSAGGRTWSAILKVIRRPEARRTRSAVSSLWVGTPAPIWLSWFTLPAHREWLERRFRRPLEDAAEPFGAFIGFALELGDEALADARV